MIRPMVILHIWFHLLNLMSVIISNIPAELPNNSRITYVMSDWRVIASTVVSILFCDPSINITSWRFCIIVSLVESVINISIVVGYSPGHSSLTYIVFDCNITGALIHYCILHSRRTLYVSFHYTHTYIEAKWLLTFTSTFFSIILAVTMYIDWIVTGILEVSDRTTILYVETMNANTTK